MKLMLFYDFMFMMVAGAFYRTSTRMCPSNFVHCGISFGVVVAVGFLV